MCSGPSEVQLRCFIQKLTVRSPHLTSNSIRSHKMSLAHGIYFLIVYARMLRRYLRTGNANGVQLIWETCSCGLNLLWSSTWMRTAKSTVTLSANFLSPNKWSHSVGEESVQSVVYRVIEQNCGLTTLFQNQISIMKASKVRIFPRLTRIHMHPRRFERGSISRSMKVRQILIHLVSFHHQQFLLPCCWVLAPMRVKYSTPFRFITFLSQSAIYKTEKIDSTVYVACTSFIHDQIVFDKLCWFSRRINDDSSEVLWYEDYFRRYWALWLLRELEIPAYYLVSSNHSMNGRDVPLDNLFHFSLVS